MAFLESLIIALLSAAAPWLVAPIKRWPIATALGIGLVLTILGAALSVGPYPWTNLVVLLVALSAGVLLGRSMPTRTWPFLILLLVLSALDIIQIVLSGPGAGPAHPAAIPPPAQLYGNLFLLLPWGRFNLGIFDIFVIAAMAEQWRRRGRALPFALIPGSIGIVLAFAFLQFIYKGVLPLIPFLTLGWLCSLALNLVLSRRPTQPAAAKGHDPAGAG